MRQCLKYVNLFTTLNYAIRIEHYVSSDSKLCVCVKGPGFVRQTTHTLFSIHAINFCLSLFFYNKKKDYGLTKKTPFCHSSAEKTEYIKDFLQTINVDR